MKKGNKSYFGYKGFISTDVEDGFITQVLVTPANKAECTQLEEIISSQDAKRIYADKAYASFNREMLKSKGFKDGIMEKASRGSPLSHWQKLKNKLISKLRFIVEQAFETLKRRFGFRRSRYRGADRVETELILKAMTFNLIPEFCI